MSKGLERRPEHYSYGAKQDSYEDQLILAIWNECKTTNDRDVLAVFEADEGSLNWMEFSTLLSIYKDLLTGQGLFKCY